MMAVFGIMEHSL